MAYMDQEKKKRIKERIDEVMPDGWKYSLRVHNHSELNLAILSANVDLIKEVVENVSDRDEGMSEYILEKKAVNINHYYLERFFSTSLPVFEKINKALNSENYDRSDAMSDYFDVGYYVSLSVGRYDKPFEYKEAPKKRPRRRGP